jgi:hypothetical protein
MPPANFISIFTLDGKALTFGLKGLVEFAEGGIPKIFRACLKFHQSAASGKFNSVLRQIFST